jgi:hypothetical protein
LAPIKAIKAITGNTLHPGPGRSKLTSTLESPPSLAVLFILALCRGLPGLALGLSSSSDVGCVKVCRERLLVRKRILSTPRLAPRVEARIVGRLKSLGDAMVGGVGDLRRVLRDGLPCHSWYAFMENVDF